MNRKKNVCVMALIVILPGLLLTILGGQVIAEEKYPTRPIDLIVPYAPGGGTDLNARLVTPYINKKWGIPVNVVNKPGGNTVPACSEVFNAVPDGYTLLADGLPTGSILPVVVKDLPFNVLERSFISMTIFFPMVFVGSPNLPVNDLKGLVDLLKKDPGSFTWGSMGGVGGTDYIMGQFFKAAGVDSSKTKPILVKGAGPAAQMTAGGHIMVSVVTLGTGLPLIKGNMVKGLAISSEQRHSFVPDIPTTSESGYPTISSTEWKGISGPPNLPPHIIGKWEKALRGMTQDPNMTSKIKNIGAAPFYRNSQEMKEHIRKEIKEVEMLFGKK